MPSHRKNKSKRTRSKIAAMKPKRAASKKKHVKASRKSKKPTQKKTTVRTSGRAEQRKSVSTNREIKQEIRGGKWTTEGVTHGQSGDLQGLSRAEQADSQSVEELVEEGNVFEAGAVAGVEESDGADEREVHAHEVPEDDVPDEYLDKE